MEKWRKRLYGYTGFFILFAIWTPMIWFISSSREYYRMEMFDLLRMHWSSIVTFAVLAVATLAAQVGFMLLAHDLSKYEAMKKPEPSYYPFR